MALKIVTGLLIVLIVFLGYVSTRSGVFRYERSGVIQAPPEKIYPYISDLRKSGLWSPYEKKDPSMARTFSGTDGTVGSKMDFDSSKGAGAGSIEILKLTPNQSADLRLTMTKPIHAENLVEYRLTPESGGTRLTWVMSGDGGFITKLVSVFINLEKMVAGDFEIGIENLKQVVEGEAHAAQRDIREKAGR